MEKRHDDQLTSRLEQVLTTGVAHILWAELYRWYDVQKLAARSYRDVVDRWEELTNGSQGRLMQVVGAGGVFLIAEKSVEPFYEVKGE